MVKKTAELLTMYGVANLTGSVTGGTLSLNGDLLQAAVNYIQIPAGMDLKIWARNNAGAAIIVNYQYSKTVTTGPFITIATDDLVAAGQFDIEKRRPVLARGTTGNEGIQLTWQQGSAGLSYIEFEIEITDDQLEELIETE